MDRRRRILALGFVIALCLGLFVVQGVTADTSAAVPANSSEPYPGNTLIAVNSYGSFSANNGAAVIVNSSGGVVWEYAPPDSRVFDAEATSNGTILASVATRVPGSECPPRYLDTERDPEGCVHNRVVEVDRQTKEVVWEYDWYDAYIHNHEVHDADRLQNGETAIIDMGRNRAFTVNKQGNVTWSWSAKKHLGPGSEYKSQYGGPEYPGPIPDWTHMNDIDRLDNGNFQLSIRNFDTVIEVDPETQEIVSTVGNPGNYSVMNHQHNPDRLEASNTMVVADSDNNRVVEYDLDSGRELWAYDGTGSGRGLQWPRDADRLPNGNTLVADSRNFRVLEVDSRGEVVWQSDLRDRRAIVYEADRLGVPEEPENVPSGRRLTSRTSDAGPVVETLRWAESWAGFVFPPWVRVPELLTLLFGLVAGIWLVGEFAVGWWRGRGS